MSHVENAEQEPKEAATLADFDREGREVIDWMLSNPEKVLRERKDLLRRLMKKRCSYGSNGGVLPMTMAPMFLNHSSMELIAQVSEKLDIILDKAVRKYFEDEHVRSYIPFPDIPEEWMRWDPGYSKPTVINRHDAIFDGKNLKFIEFNTDNPGGRGWLDTYDDIFRNHSPYADLVGKYAQGASLSMLKAVHRAFLNCYREAGGQKEKPRAAMVAFKKYLAGGDTELVRDYLIEQGMETNFVDPRDFEFRNGVLYSGNVPFDILNLNLRFVFFKRFPAELRDFMEAIKKGAVCSINPFRSSIGSQKEMMSFLTNEENHHYFTEDEVECIQKYVPWTRRMDETITISREGTDVALQEYCVKNREDLVLKPTFTAGGQDVHVGKACDSGEWNDAVENAIGCSWWIIQEAVEIPEYEFPIVKDKKVVLEKRNLNLSPYVIHGEYVGCLGRISDSKVINVSSGGGIIPVFTLKAG